MTETDLPAPVSDLLVRALEHGVQSVAEGGPLVPFALVDDGEGLHLHRFWTGELAQSQEQARTWLREQTGFRRACVAWDGYLTADGERTDAIYADGCDDSGTDGWVAAQRYVQVGGLEVWAASGAPVLCGRSPSLLGA